VEQHFLGLLQRHQNIEIKWGMAPFSLNVDSASPDDMSAYPVQVDLKTCDVPDVEVWDLTYAHELFVPHSN
jgi:hypothetical protein